MQHIDEARLETDLAYRFEYLATFMNFTAADIAVIHASAPLLAPLVPSLVDAVYAKLQQQDATWRHFVPRQFGYDGALPQSVDTLSMDDPQIQFRKEHLGRYLAALVTRPYDGKMVQYLDMVGKIHTNKAGSKELQIPLVQMNALMGFVADAFIATIIGLKLDRTTEVAALRAFSKLLWLQNDLIVRHYAAAAEELAAV
ncbi:protoglobin family protein [Tuwongella immobilis]|uniref:Globin-sensor domain-containing protein n=1 Tax=Tuwongella immobilis TaxID=692036 RepID=A0A6C2YUI4_9BACT|nr:protoglobin family protein [Tuwongella immobilis]VIP04813.1 hypothetical protein : Uncharacterized protein OS=Pirellula staleyi (strain ATCC 27377 / DSM 6068 / ICPB 4128) GN=Psta_2760 PE=4 SV=1: Protoglobin [Tuwongella immobilis]VTS06986.1 hypothetical protein : Uncharacterized protein OS=Pirellula staleyi (strain ATCC 27377 / DSM 6068 / ICPB 4128) GN=Psta_2760 PE=4 SV=1: Protoglobin [Tuwongella immobilis]